MKKSLLTLLAASALAGSALAQSTLYMNPAYAGNLTTFAVWATNLGGTGGFYTQPWSDGNNMYFDPTNTSAFNYTINANITTGGTITVGNSNTNAQIVSLNASSTNTIWFTNVTFLDTVSSDQLKYAGPTLPGGDLTVSGKGSFQLTGTPTASISGTITLNTNATLLIANSGYVGTNRRVIMNGSGSSTQFQIGGGTTATIGQLETGPGGTAATIVASGGANSLSTLIVDQTNNTTFAGSFGFTATKPGLVQKQGSGNLTFSGNSALANQYTDYAVSGGKFIVATNNNNTTAADYNAIAVNAVGTLASDATGRTLVGNSQTLSSGLITTNGTNSNGFIATTAGATSIIDPTGTFALTQLEATNGLTLKIDSATDRLSLYTLAGATNAGGFRIDLTGFSGIADNTTYTVLSWVSATNVDLTDFAGVLGSGKSMNSSFGTGGFDFFTSAGVTSLQLQVVPEPTTWALLAGAGAFLVVMRRRKRA